MHTNQTAHYHLPQYVGTDIINPLTDTNGAYEAIDTAIYEVGQTASGMASDIDALKIQNGDSALDTTAQTLSGAVNELKSGADALGLRVTGNETDISTLQTQMSTATGNITTLNTSVAGLQTEMAGKASATALNNLTTKVGTGNLNTTAQNCVDAINEVLAELPSGGSVSADDVTYDNNDSGLTATNVQDAIDEVKADIPTIPTSYDADDIVYDNQTSGLTATDVQSAIDELAQSSATYSTTERAVGVDTDGSVVYERSYVADNVNISTATVIDANFTPSVIKHMIADSFGFYDETNHAFMPMYDTVNNGTAYSLQWRIDTNGLRIIATNATISKYHLTFRYTKN